MENFYLIIQWSGEKQDISLEETDQLFSAKKVVIEAKKEIVKTKQFCR